MKKLTKKQMLEILQKANSAISSMPYAWIFQTDADYYGMENKKVSITFHSYRWQMIRPDRGWMDGPISCDWLDEDSEIQMALWHRAKRRYNALLRVAERMGCAIPKRLRMFIH